MAPDIHEDRDVYYLDGLDRVWVYDEGSERWFSPDIPGTSCTWKGVHGFAHGELREATPQETAEIDEEMFS